MLTHTELWKLIEPLIKEEGLELYDIERGAATGGKGGVIRIFIARAGDAPSADNDSSEGITLDNCAEVSRKISALDRFEELIPERTTLEVSSPGVNRKLRRDEHFTSAVGEHVWIKGHYAVKGEDRSQKESVIRGVLAAFNDDTLTVREDDSERELLFHIGDVTSARIDFIF